jgi:fatty acid-binding protein DegV
MAAGPPGRREMVRIVTDNRANISPEPGAGPGIAVVPLHIRFGGETYHDGVGIIEKPEAAQKYIIFYVFQEASISRLT